MGNPFSSSKKTLQFGKSVHSHPSSQPAMTIESRSSSLRDQNSIVTIFLTKLETESQNCKSWKGSQEISEFNALATTDTLQ